MRQSAVRRGVRRRAVLLVVLALLSLAACGGNHPRPEKLITPAAPTTTRPPATRPNILVIEDDDMRTDELRWMPNVRRLIAAKGLTFMNSFAPYPLCCPSRSSFLTGEYAHNHHVYSHLNPWGFKAFEDKDTLATELQKVGYHTGLVGKYLNGYGQQRLLTTHRSSLHYVPPGWDEWMAGSDHLWQPGQIHQGGTYDYFDLTQNINGRIVSWPGDYSTDVLARQAGQVMTKFGKDNAKPWFLWWTPVAPHHGTPIEPDDPPRDMRRRDGHKDEWESPARPDWVKGIHDKQITHGLGTPPNHPAEADVSDKPRYLRGLPPLTRQEKAAETTITRQRAEALTVLDERVGQLISQLSRQGELDRTLIMFTSDNGYYLGEHRRRQGKITLHEPSLRVPLIIAGPGIPRGRRFDPVTTVDLPTTIASYAGAALPRTDGMDLRQLIEHGDTGWKRPVITEAMMEQHRYRIHHALGPSPLNTRGLRLGQWKLTLYSHRHEEELYDLALDPLELTSLQHDPGAKRIYAQLVQLYGQYHDCRGAQCLAPLPRSLWLTPKQEKRLTLHQIRATDAYYGNHSGLASLR